MSLEAAERQRAYQEDRELVARCLSGERAAQRRLFEREKRRVHATLYRIAGHNRGMDDMLQETFIAVFQSLHQYRGEARLSTWIDRCAVHVALKQLKAARRSQAAPERENVESGAASAELRMGHRQALLRLYGVLDALDAKQRVAYALHVLEGRTVREIAELTDASVVATKVRIFRARREVERRARHDPLLAEFVVQGATLEPGEVDA